MFFSQDLLQKRGGKFGIIWVAATRGTGLSRRDYIKVNVKQSCDDIIRYLMHQHPASREGLSRPRLSLYLSSQLMYGVVKVYDQQQKILNNDATNLLTKFHASLIPALDIDLKAQHARREVLESPLVEDFMLADQDFYQLNLHLDEMPDIACFAIASPVRSLHSGTPSSLELKSPSFRADLGSPHQASQEQITLVESPMPRVIDILIPGDKDLPPLREAEVSTEDEDPLAKEQTSAEDFGDFLIPTELDMDQGLLPPTEETFGPPPDPEDAVREPLTKRPPRGQSVTPPSSPVPQKRRRRDFHLLLTPVTPNPLRRVRRLKKLIVDDESQLSKDQQRLNFQHGAATCAPMSYPNTAPSLTQLFHDPARKQMQRKAFKRLWTRNIVARQGFETDSERGAVAWTVPDLGMSLSASEKDSPVEEAREELPLPGVSPVRMLDDSHEPVELARETSAQSSMLLPNESVSRSRLDPGISFPEDALPSPRHTLSFINLSESRITENPVQEASQLMDIPEDLEVTPQDLLDPEASGSSSGESSPFQLSVWHKLDSSTTNQTWTNFKEICPLSTSKRLAAHTFSALLELCGSGMITAVQREPYGEIELSRGMKWSQPTPASTNASP